MATDFISRISPHGMQGGELSRLFVNGMRAVILRDDDRIRTLVESVFDWLGINDSNPADVKSSFGKNLLDLARNHISGNMGAGDILRFEPGRIVHIARKFVVYRSTVDQSLKSFPDTFRSDHQSAPVPYRIKELASSLMLDVLASILPGVFDSVSSYATQVEILIYPGSRSDVDKLGTILGDSCGRWSRWGNWIDAYRNNAYGVFDVKLVRDLYALGSLLPGLSRLLGTVNRRMTSLKTGSVPKNHFLLGRSHVDNGKYITALAGCRDNLFTQVLGAKTWIPLQVAPDTLAIFPSPKITPQSGIPATFHRILLCDPPDNGNDNRQNISLSLSIIDRPEWLQ